MNEERMLPIQCPKCQRIVSVSDQWLGKHKTINCTHCGESSRLTDKEVSTLREAFGYWFGIVYTFVCPKCSEVNIEKAVVTSTTDNPEKLNPVLNREKLACQHCKAPLVDGVQVRVNVQPGTPEQLRKSGFPLPDHLIGN